MVRHSNFDQSMSYFKKLLDENKKNDYGDLCYYFYYFSVFSFFLDDIEDYSYEEKYESFFKEVSSLFETKLSRLQKLKKIIKKDNQENNINVSYKIKKINQQIAENSFYYGGILGFKGLHEVNFDNWWDAFFLGNDAVKLLKKSLQYSANFYEPYYGLGIYYYWKGVKGKDLWYVPFIKDSRESGIKAIKISLEKSELVQVESQMSLVRIGINEMDDEMIEKYSKGFFDKYPDNIYLHRIFIRHYAQRKDYQKMKFYLDHLNSLKEKYLKYDLTLFSMFLNYYYAIFYFNVENDYIKGNNYLEKNLQKKKLTNKRGNIIFNNYLQKTRKLIKELFKKSND